MLCTWGKFQAICRLDLFKWFVFQEMYIYGQSQKNPWLVSTIRVATAKGKQGIQMFIFPDREKHNEFAKDSKEDDFTQGISL